MWCAVTLYVPQKSSNELEISALGNKYLCVRLLVWYANAGASFVVEIRESLWTTTINDKLRPGTPVSGSWHDN